MRNTTEIEFEFETEDCILCDVQAEVWGGEESDGISPPCGPEARKLAAYIDGKFFALSSKDLDKAELIAVQKYLAE